MFLLPRHDAGKDDSAAFFVRMFTIPPRRARFPVTNLSHELGTL
jgi:hypothetical protein